MPALDWSPIVSSLCIMLLVSSRRQGVRGRSVGNGFSCVYAEANHAVKGVGTRMLCLQQ